MPIRAARSTTRAARRATSSRGGLRVHEELPFGRDLVLERCVLDNGLTLLMLVDHAAPVVSYQTWFKVGSRHERPGKTGLAHLFEHLMFKETANHPLGNFDRLMELEGAEVNAATWTDWTCYYENLPRGALELAVQLESDRMSNLVLQDEQVASERDVVANERRHTVDDDVESKAAEVLYATAFQSHPYRWPTIGWMKDIHGLSVADCKSFYGTYYAPNNATVVVVGDFDPKAVLGLVRSAYGHLPAAKIPREKKVVEPAQKRQRRRTLRLPTDTHKVVCGYKAPPYGGTDYAALVVLNEILCGGRSSRLRWRLVTDDEIATDVGGGLAPFEHGGLYDFCVDGRKGQTGTHLLSVLDEELDKIGTELPPDDEIEKAKNRLELSFLSGLETMSGKADQIGFDATVLGDPVAAFRHLGQYRAVTAADVQSAARRYLDRSQRTVVFVEPRA